MAQIPGSIRVTGFIAPSDSTDIYATHDSTYGRGGLREVATIVERDAITADRRKEGMVVYVEEDGQTYQLVGGVDNADWEIFGNAAATIGSYVTTVNGVSGAIELVGGNGIEVAGLTISVSADYALNSYVETASANAYAYTDAQVLAASGNLVTFIEAVSGNAYAYTDAQVLALSGSLATSIADVSAAAEGHFVHITGDETISGEKQFLNNALFASAVTICGDLYVAGSTTTVASSAVSVADRIITVNAGEVGPGVTNLFAGLEVDRGTGAPYYMVFDETRDAFTIGTPGGPITDAGTLTELQVVATREDAPVDKAVVFWQDAGSPSGGHLMVTNAGLTFDAATQTLTAANIFFAPTSAANWSVVPDHVAPALDILASGLVNAATALADVSASLYAIDVATSGNLVSLIESVSANAYAYTDAQVLAASGNLVTFIESVSANAYAYTDAQVLAASGNLVTFIETVSGNAYAYTDTQVLAASGNAYAYTDAQVLAASGNLVTFVETVSANAYAYTDAQVLAASGNLMAYTDSVSASIAQNIVNLVRGGTINCDTTNYLYSVTHDPVTAVATAFPVVSLTTPLSSSVLYVQAVCNRSTTGFDIVLSDVPDVAGYAINWILFVPYGA